MTASKSSRLYSDLPPRWMTMMVPRCIAMYGAHWRKIAPNWMASISSAEKEKPSAPSTEAAGEEDEEEEDAEEEADDDDDEEEEEVGCVGGCI